MYENIKCEMRFFKVYINAPRHHCSASLTTRLTASMSTSCPTTTSCACVDPCPCAGAGALNNNNDTTAVFPRNDTAHINAVLSPCFGRGIEITLHYNPCQYLKLGNFFNNSITIQFKNQCIAGNWKKTGKDTDTKKIFSHEEHPQQQE